MAEIGEKIDVEIARRTSDGRASGFSTDGRLVIITGTDEDDEIVKVEITNIMEETYFGKKMKENRGRKTKSVEPEEPYEMDDDEDDKEDFED